MVDTLPSSADKDIAVQVDAAYSDPIDKSLWVHKDLVKVREPWAVAPPRAEEPFGDVESWAAYVKRFGSAEPFTPLTSWNSAGLRAVLDYHVSVAESGRMQWNATLPFLRSPEWTAWLGIATGHGIAQRAAVEFLDDHSPDITDPDAGTLMAILSSLRAQVNKSASTELRPDGTTSVTWAGGTNVAARGGTADLPPEFSITIPILKGHDVRYKLAVKLRASVDDQAHLTLRFSIPQAERALEAVYAEVVGSAKTLLGDGFTLLRSAG